MPAMCEGLLSKTNIGGVPGYIAGNAGKEKALLYA